jgi:hypothetical protein
MGGSWCWILLNSFLYTYLNSPRINSRR